MEWWVLFILIIGSILLLMATGMPVALAFLLVNLVGVFIFWSGEVGLHNLAYSIFSSLSTFTLIPLPLFMLMGEVMYLSGVAPHMIDALDKWMGRLPGRLALLAVAGGTLFATLTGSSQASVAMLGSTLVPEMEKRGYKKPMSLGPIMGSGGLAIMIPPSGIAILLASIGKISIAGILIAIIIPGLLMAAVYAAYIITRCWLQPSIAPAYDVSRMPLSVKIISFVKYVLPIGLIVFLVIGLMFIGAATPTESAATGTLGCFMLAACYKRLNWEVVKHSVLNALSITVMVFTIIMGAATFSQILSISGAGRELAEFATSLPVAPILTMVAMQVVGIILGMFMNQAPIIMITIPIFMPIVRALGFDPVWFGAIYMLNMEMAILTPPFGMALFVMKGVAPAGTTIADCIRAAVPFILMDTAVMIAMILFPPISLWLPGLMRG